MIDALRENIKCYKVTSQYRVVTDMTSLCGGILSMALLSIVPGETLNTLHKM